MAPRTKTSDGENGVSGLQEWKNHMETGANTDLDEYRGLVRYISTYREGRRKSSVATFDAAVPTKAPWYAPWKGSKSVKTGLAFEYPDEWLDTNIQHGLSGAEVESRRRKTGWNELTTEKTNLFVQFLSYFKGPILYGTSWAPFHFGRH